MQHTQSHKSSVKQAASMPTQRRPVSQQTQGSLTGRPPSRPSNTPFWHTQHTFHAHQGEQPTGGQIQTWLATSPRLGRPYSGTHSPSMVAPPPPHLRSSRPPLEVAMLQPAPGTPIGRQSSGYSATPRHTRPMFRTRGDQKPTEGLSKYNGSMAVDWHATSGHASPIIESNHIALTHSGKEAS